MNGLANVRVLSWNYGRFDYSETMTQLVNLMRNFDNVRDVCSRGSVAYGSHRCMVSGVCARQPQYFNAIELCKWAINIT